MTRRLPPLLSLALAIFLTLAAPGEAGVAPAPGKDGEKASPAAIPAREVKMPLKIEKPAPSPAVVTLDPFFLILQEASRVRVRRIQVALEFLQPDFLKNFDPQAPRFRELVYDFLAGEQGQPAAGGKERDNILAGLVNRYLGQEAVSAVKVDQTFLLLR